jgi:hypothetical protein
MEKFKGGLHDAYYIISAPVNAKNGSNIIFPYTLEKV